MPHAFLIDFDSSRALAAVLVLAGCVLYACASSPPAPSRAIEQRHPAATGSYVSAVRSDNQRAFNSELVPCARYLMAVHQRFHPIFTDTELVALDELPAIDPINDRSLAVTLELVLDGQQGGLLRHGVIASSGIASFDELALKSVERAAPFGPPPPGILSSDGNFYVHWTFRRDQLGCSPLGAHPYRLAL